MDEFHTLPKYCMYAIHIVEEIKVTDLKYWPCFTKRSKRKKNTIFSSHIYSIIQKKNTFHKNITTCFFNMAFGLCSQNQIRFIYYGFVSFLSCASKDKYEYSGQNANVLNTFSLMNYELWLKGHCKINSSFGYCKSLSNKVTFLIYNILIG